MALRSVVAFAVLAGLLGGCARAPTVPVPTIPEPDPMDRSDPTASHRARMVAAVRAWGGPWPGEAWDPAVLDALGRVPRHAFVPELPLGQAYEDAPQPIARGQTISQPTVVAMMAQALELTPGARTLEVGTGSGYHAAVLAELGADLYTIERHAPLAERARAALSAQGYGRVQVRAGDGYLGWPERAPFDAILVTAAPEQIPLALLDQLAEGGRLVAPIGPQETGQRLVRLRRLAGEIVPEDLGAVRFVPMLPGEVP